MNLLVDESLISYSKPVIYSGLQAFKHNPNTVSTFDTFDRVNPSVYIADADWLNETVLKNIAERPAMRVVVIQKNQADDPHPAYQKMQDRFGDSYLWIVNDGHADLLEYYRPEFSSVLKSNIVSIEDIPVSGIENLVLPESVKVKIFSVNLVNSNYFCGYILPEIRKNAYKSAKLSISTGNNIYNSILCDCLPVQIDNDILNILNSDNTQKIKELKEIVHNSKNNFIDISYILEKLGMDKESKLILSKMKEVL